MHMNRSRHLLRNSLEHAHGNRPSHCPCCLMVGHSQTRSGVDGCPGTGGSCRVAWKGKLGAYSVQQRQSLQGHLWDSHSSQVSGIGCWYAHTCAFRNYLADRQARVGGFLPVFWHSPHNVICATVDIGQMVEWISQQLQLEAGENGCLAVLHNRRVR